MDTKPLLFGLIGFFLGGLIVSIAATALNTSDMSTSQMTTALKDQRGDEFDKAFVASMIQHHEGAVKMAELSAANAKHAEIKQLSHRIITAQQSEITQMRQWMVEWGYWTDQHAQHDSH